MRSSLLGMLLGAIVLVPAFGGTRPADAAQEEAVKPPPPDDAGLEARLAESEKARRALEKRLDRLEKSVAEAAAAGPETDESILRLEGALASLERKIGGSSETPGGIVSRLDGLERAGSDLAKRLAQAEAGLPRLRTRLAALESARTRYDKLLLQSLELHQALTERVKELKKAHEAVKAALSAENKDRRSLENRVAENARRREAAEKALSRLAAEVTGEKRRRVEQGKSLDALEERHRKSESRVSSLLGALDGQGRRLTQAEAFGRETRKRAAAVGDDLRAVKFAMLYSVRDPQANPYRDHYPYLGIVHEYLDGKTATANGLEEGEGLRIRRISTSGPAHASPLLRGDLILRVDGAPVRSSGIVRPGTVVSRWEKRAPMPTYITDRLPGDSVEIEFVRFGEPDRVRLTLSCRKCGAACPFTMDREGE